MVIWERLNLKQVDSRSDIDAIRQGKHTVVGAESFAEQVEDGNNRRSRGDALDQIMVRRAGLVANLGASSERWAVEKDPECVIQTTKKCEWRAFFGRDLELTSMSRYATEVPEQAGYQHQDARSRVAGPTTA